MGGAVVLPGDQEPMDGSAATETAQGGPASSSQEDASGGQGPASTQTPAVSPYMYAPQFAGLEALILARIRAHDQDVKPGAAPQASSAPSSSDGPGSSLEGGHEAGTGAGADEEDGSGKHSSSGRLADTLAMPTPSGQDTLTAAARIQAANSLRTLSRKRKRDDGEAQAQDKGQDENEDEDAQHSREPVDFSQSTISFPPQVLKAPQPPLAPTVQEDADMPDAAAPAAVDKELERLRVANLAALPRGIVPAKPELVGFPAGPASDLAFFKYRRITGLTALQLSTYFYGRKKTDLLNILSLCDQLKPQLLVDVLVSVAKRHPDLPIFPSPSWNPDAPHPDTRPALKIRLKHSSNSSSNNNNNNNNNATSATNNKSSLFLSHRRRLLHQRPRHGHVIAPDSKARHKHKTPRAKIAKGPPAAAAAAAAAELDRDPDADEDPTAADLEHADSLPPTWPRADQGLYARLAAEDQDRALLLDENDEEAFSHFAVDKYGKQTALLVLPAAA
ncbi:hypothetical protein ESCO_004706 [Escovopsis weberi]|uniref:Uncharacterized protein n=1 Tax=Escovopsis weberi TaxID=150374 RepID=A0A0M9VRJ9_ESCWE|nr:hypothetical protein ESCO_004706 [Escovopsis weberi]